MPLLCRESSAIVLEQILRKSGPTSLGSAARQLNRGMDYTRSLVRQFPETFHIVSVAGNVSRWCIGIADTVGRIHFVLDNPGEAPGD
jgi:hypothetical protein